MSLEFCLLASSLQGCSPQRNLPSVGSEEGHPSAKGARSAPGKDVGETVLWESLFVSVF